MATKRGYLLEELTRGMNAIDKANIHFERVATEFQDVYPTVSVALITVMEQLEVIKDVVKKVQDKI